EQAVTEVVSKDAVTHDMRHLVLRLIEPTEIKFFPGQYVDIAIPDTGAVRSFSMANTSSRESGLLEFVGGGAGMAPILSLLRTLAERGLTRKATFFYGARTKKDLCFEAELHALEDRLPDFRYIPALSEPGDEEWDGETGLITDVVKRHASDLRGAHAYVCGPPPMVEAALPLLATLGVEEKRIYYDKFTTTGNPQE